MAVAKVATKGQKQIHQENLATLRFYLIMAVLGCGIHLTIQFLLFSPSTKETSLFFVSLFIQIAALFCMKMMAKTTYSENGQLLDAGLDLNMEGGFGESCKDLIILTFATQVVSLISTYFWLVLLCAPLYGLFKLWTSFLSPWFFAQNDEETDEKGKTGRGKQKDQQRVKYKRI